jgi:chromosome segregation ATPase
LDEKVKPLEDKLDKMNAKLGDSERKTLEVLKEKTVLEQQIKEETTASNNLKSKFAQQMGEFKKEVDELKSTLAGERATLQALKCVVLYCQLHFLRAIKVG